MDVVPYITGISTRLDEAYSSDPSAFNRSALGGYPVLRNEENIHVSGFNLKNGNTAPTVSIGEITSSSIENIILSIPNTATSGDLNVTVNGVQSLNNFNSVEAEYNKEPNSSNNRILNNRRRLYVWGNEGKVDDVTIRYPTFRVGPNGEEVFSYDSGGTGTYLYKNGTSYLVGESFTQWYDTVVSIDNYGQLYGLALNGDCASPGSVNTGYCASFYLYPLVTSNMNIWAYGDDYAAFSRTDASAWENTSNGRRYNPNRIQNPKLVTTYNDGTSYIYSTYYDSTEKLLKFRAGTIAMTTSYTQQNNTNRTFTYDATRSQFSTNAQNLSGYVNPGDNNYYSISYIERTGNMMNYKYWYSIEGYSGTNNFQSRIYNQNQSLTASANIGNYSNGSNGSATGYQTIDSGNNASAYSALTVYNGTAIVCWYDSFAKSLKLKYNTAPLTGTTWSTAITIDSNLAGWYPDMVVDKEGGIHISYYGAKNGDLKYAYLSSYEDQVADVCTIDSFLSVGTRTSISVSTKKQEFTVGNETFEKYVPFISYYMGAFTATQTCLRTAWPVALDTNITSNATNTYADGAVSDMYTGNWEVQTLPLDSFPSDYTIGIGVKQTSETDAVAAKAEGNIILGYGTIDGLETARLY